MENNQIYNHLTSIFRTTFNNDALNLTHDLTANDVENWDSLTHMLLITEIESFFSIKFTLKELNKLRNVGDIVEIIHLKV